MNYFLKTKNIEITPEELADLNRQAGKKKSVWPEKGTPYWFTYEDGEKAPSKWDGVAIDKFRFLSGNFFLTEEAVDKRLEYLNALHSIRQFVLEEGLEFTPDWEDEEQEKWFIWKNCERDFMSTSLMYSCLMYSCYYGPKDLPYFKNDEDAKKVLDEKTKELEIVFSW